jgi:hypothetical protein
MAFNLRLAVLLVALAAFARAANDGAIIDGPNYSFSIRAPEGWRMTSTRLFQAAFYPAGTTFEKTPTLLYVRSANKEQLHVDTVEGLNQLDLRGIQQRHPKAESKRVGSTRTSDGQEVPVYAFFGGGYFEQVAYAEQPKTITVFVASSETADGLKSAEKAFRDLIGSYLFISEDVTIPTN